MAYYGDRVGGYPLGPADLVEDALGGNVGRGGYGVPRFDGFERGGGRPLGGEFLGGPPEYFDGERPGLGRGGYGMEPGLGREGYGMEGLGRERYGREPGFGRDGYPAPSFHDDGYPASRRPMMPPPIDYRDGEPSDLGMGLRDAGKAEYMRPGGYDMMRSSELGGYGGAPGYGAGAERGYGGPEEEVRRLRKELEHERRQKRQLELATGAAVGYGLHERNEKEEAEDEEDDDSDDDGKKGKKHHRLLQKLGL